VIDGAFFIACRQPEYLQPLFALSTLVSGTRQQLAMFMLSHLFSALFNNAAQWITSFRFGRTPS
jgi:hypothetical protein